MSEEPKNKTPNSRENPCPICGHTDYSWGQAITSNDAPTNFFTSDPIRQRGKMGIWGFMPVCVIGARTYSFSTNNSIVRAIL